MFGAFTTFGKMGAAAGGITLAQRIRALFAAGEQGVLYDPSDFSTMFQDAAGTTPVTAVTQPVGKILDKSGRGNHATQATSTKRPLLQQDATGRYYLAFDGVDDALVTGSIDFTATDKMSVFAGVRKLSDASRGTFIEMSSSVGNNGTFLISAPFSASDIYRFSLHGSGANINDQSIKAGFAAPVTNVITASMNNAAAEAADQIKVRINTASVATSGALATGTGNYGNHALYIGSRAGTSLPFNGHLYSLIVRGAQSTDAQIAAAEAYCNQRTGAF